MKAIHILAVLAAVMALAMSGCGGGGGTPNTFPGVWRSQFVNSTFGPGLVELAIQSNGSFSQQTTYARGSLVTIFGTWRVVGNVFRLDVQRGEPRQFCGPLGCTDILYPSESHIYTFNGPNAMHLSNAACSGNPDCEFTYGRVN
ncbi:MAG: hypothetical protein QM758_19090 [Armatimonas sp.]